MKVVVLVLDPPHHNRIDTLSLLTFSVIHIFVGIAEFIEDTLSSGYFNIVFLSDEAEVIKSGFY